MRVHYLFLAAWVGFLANGEAGATMETNVVGLSLRASEGTVQGKRHLRTDQKADGNLNEERATVTLGTKLYDKVATTKWLEGLLEKGESLKKVKEQYLKISSTLPKEKMVFHPNWNAYAKYERMHFEKATGKKVAYAYFGSIPQSEKNTEEVLQGWIIAGRSDESVGKYLGVWGLPPSEQVLHVNWRAFKKYKKWHAQYLHQQDMQFSNFGAGYHSKKKTTDILTQWAMAGDPIKEIEQTLRVKGLTGTALEMHENYKAILLYKKLFNDYAPYRALNQLSRAKATLLKEAAKRGHKLA